MGVWDWAALGSLLWLTWCISCSILHALMMIMMMLMMRHAPPSPSARVAYYFSPVLPAWPWLTLDCPTLHHHHHLPHRLGNPNLWDLFAQLTAWLAFCSDWLIGWPWTIPMNPAAPVMHSWTSACRNSGLFFFIYIYIPHAVDWTCWPCFVNVPALVWWAFGL